MLFRSSAVDGAVSAKRNGRDRFRAFNGALHTFDPLDAAPGGERTRQGSLWAFGLSGLFVALTGVYLALPKRWKVRRQPHGQRG